MGEVSAPGRPGIYPVAGRTEWPHWKSQPGVLSFCTGLSAASVAPRRCFVGGGHTSAVLMHLNHGVASPFPPRVKVGSETLMESLSTGAGSQSPRGACFVRSAVTPFPLNLRVARVYVPSHKAKEVNTARPRAGKACLSSPPSPAPSSIKQQYSNINVPFLFAVTCCGYSDFSYSN